MSLMQWVMGYLSMTTTAVYALLCENMTLSTKPEVHNVLHALSSEETETRLSVTCAESFVKFGRVVMKHVSGQLDRQTDRQTNRHADRRTSLTYRR